MRPVFSFLYSGKGFVDPINEKSYRKFLPYGYGKLRKNALSPGTFSLERHRLLWLYLKNETTFLEKKLKVLHIAPEQIFYKKFKQLKKWEYITLDLQSPLAQIKADVCHLPLNDNSFDLIFCNHVLEHIEEDAKAMKELFRVLKRGGTAILQVPINEKLKKTYEDPAIKKPKERTVAFGQYDHVRVYGLDYLERLKKAGFQVEFLNYATTFSKEQIQKYGLMPNEKIPIARKKGRGVKKRI